MLYSDSVPLPIWKIRILGFVARQLGILIHVNGMPFGPYDHNQYSNEELDTGLTYKPIVCEVSDQGKRLAIHALVPLKAVVHLGLVLNSTIISLSLASI